MPEMNRKDLFDFMQRRIDITAADCGDKKPQAFGRWFSKMFFGEKIIETRIYDGPGDGKVDLVVSLKKGNTISHVIINSKYTEEYDKSSPVAFYDEITRYYRAFENRNNRNEYLKVVREDLVGVYKKLFRDYDEGSARLFFITNHRKNEKQYKSVKNYRVEIFHLDDILNYTNEYIEGAMPETDPITFRCISNVLTPNLSDTEIPTSIVFARLIDFVEYMEEDPLELLFARNVRLWLGNTESNTRIMETILQAPKEFAYSNNGITLLCNKKNHDSGKQELTLINPRVVNGSQTLHSVQKAWKKEQPSKTARVMVRIIQIPTDELAKMSRMRREIIHKISIRSNMQNPIKAWDLVSSDEYQMEISRYFWSKKMYYERRRGEWKVKRSQLTASGIKQGPDIKWMTQLISTYHYQKSKLGPAVAQGRLKTLFEDESVYVVIRETSPELAFSLYYLAVNMNYYLNKWAKKRDYINNIQGGIKFSLFALLCKLCNELSVPLKNEKYGEYLMTMYNENDSSAWIELIKDLIDCIKKHYEKAENEEKKIGNLLPFVNYVKSSRFMRDLIESKINGKISKKAKIVFIKNWQSQKQ